MNNKKEKALKLQARKGMYGIKTKSLDLLETINSGMEKTEELEKYTNVLSKNKILEITKVINFSKEITEVINKYIDQEEEQWKI